jgi:hypothetical protein
MPHIIDVPDFLEHTSPPSDCDTSHALPLPLPAARRGRSTLFASLRGCLTALRRRWTHQTPHEVPRLPSFELPMDILARQYPDLYLRTMTGSG